MGFAVWRCLATLSCTMKLTIAPNIFPVKLYFMPGWNFDCWAASGVNQSASTFHDDTASYCKKKKKSYEWTMSHTLPHGRKQVSQPVEWESHSFSCRQATTWVSFPLHASASVDCPQWSLPFTVEKRLSRVHTVNVLQTVMAWLYLIVEAYKDAVLNINHMRVVLCQWATCNLCIPHFFCLQL